MIAVRPIQPDDEQFLWDMLALAIYTAPGQASWSTAAVQGNRELSRYVAGWGREGDFGVVAETGNVPVGRSLGTPHAAGSVRLWLRRRADSGTDDRYPT